jgi:ribosomal protein L11 methyltransferase
MEYVALSIDIEGPFKDIVIAELGNAGFESFEDTPTGFKGYIPSPDFDVSNIEGILMEYAEFTSIGYAYETLPDKNWNEEWEKAFQPVSVTDQIYIRAVFHPANEAFKHQLVIQPKQAFGTGHHTTTSLMLENMLTLKFEGTRVLDCGTGTGILAILAHKLGSAYINAYDTDSWSIENTQENLNLNEVSGVEVWQGKITDLTLTEPFNIVLANINRNILIAEMAHYAAVMAVNGQLLLSGFYKSDIDLVSNAATKAGLTFVKEQSGFETWTVLHFEKSLK